MFVLVPVPHCLHYCSFVILSVVGRDRPPAWFLFLRIALAILGPLWLPINFWIVKNVMGNLVGIALNL